MSRLPSTETQPPVNRGQLVKAKNICIYASSNFADSLRVLNVLFRCRWFISPLLLSDAVLILFLSETGSCFENFTCLRSTYVSEKEKESRGEPKITEINSQSFLVIYLIKLVLFLYFLSDESFGPLCVQFSRLHRFSRQKEDLSKDGFRESNV